MLQCISGIISVKYPFYGFLMIGLLLSCRSEIYFEGAYCIKNVNVINPLEGLKKGVNVVVKGNKIHRIGKVGELKLSPKNVIIDGKNKYLIPGLWDSHVHFYFDQQLALHMPELFLSNGITSVRDTGGAFHYMDSIRQNALMHPKTHPRVKIAGPLIDGNFNVYNGSVLPELSIRTRDVRESIAETEKLVVKGVDFLKAYEMLSPEQFEAIAAIAAREKLRLAGHVPLSMEITHAISLGLNSLEHIKNLELEAVKNSDSMLLARRDMLHNKSLLSGRQLRANIHRAQKQFAVDNIAPDAYQNILDTIKKYNSYQVPTLSIYKVPIYKIFREPFWRKSFELLPKTTRDQWEKSLLGSNDKINQAQKAFSDWIQKTTGAMAKAEIPLMAGTDTPLGYLTPGFSLHYELELMVESGLTELQALTTATLQPSKYFRMEDSLGLVKKDYIADLILLNENPLEEIARTKDIFAVIKDGNFIDKARLDQLQKEISEGLSVSALDQ
ncbi:MAG: amidohydrolase family protein [Flavobacteriaceae bacterium]|nr:amidohydrolase family protein [Flavobacteriaceae bacterium]